MTDLATFTPEPRVVEAGGLTLHVLPLKIGRLAEFTRAMAPIGGSLVKGDLISAFVGGFEHLRAGIAIGAGVEESWLDDLDADQFLALAIAVIDVNASFFRARLQPAMAAAVTTMIAGKAPAGAASSPASAA